MPSRLPHAVRGGFALSCALLSLQACDRRPSRAYETPILQERIDLARGARTAVARREWTAATDATCVAIIEEADSDITLTLAAAGGQPVAVESQLDGEGIEIAALHVARAARVTLTLTAPSLNAPTVTASTRVLCYADDGSDDPRVAALTRAYLAWARATPAGANDFVHAKDRISQIDAAIASLESPAGDPRMAAWARLERGNLLYKLELGYANAYQAAREAERAFTALTPADPHGLARARFHAAAALIELVNDGKASQPTAAEAEAGARRILLDLARPGSALRPLERARVLNHHGLLCYELSDYPCAEQYMRLAVDAMRAGQHSLDEYKVVANLGTVAMERGDHRAAAGYYAQVIPHFDVMTDATGKEITLVNAGYIEAALGHTGRSIELLTRAGEIARASGSIKGQGRVAHGLGTTYWWRGDMGQAETFFAEALRLRRLASDANGMNASLRMSGMLARENGDVAKAIALHREAVEHATTPATLLRAKVQLGRDHAAAGDYARAIDITREAIAIDAAVAPIRHADAQLAVIEYQLASRAAMDFTAARAVTRQALEVAGRAVDPLMELKARRFNAALLAASGDTAGARREYERAISLIFDFRGGSSSPELQATSLAHEQATFRDYVDLLMRAAVARGRGEFADAGPSEERALRVLELARALNFDAVRDTRLDAARQARVDDLLQRMAAKRVHMAALQERAAPAGRDLEQLQLDMARLRVEVDTLRGPAAKAPASELPAIVSRPWSRLAPTVAQISYALGHEHAYVWVRDARGLRVAVLAESPRQIERRLDDFTALDHLGDPGKVQGALRGLSATLLPPGILATDSAAIDVVAEGQMATVPFAALRSPHDRTRLLVATHSVRMITSMFETRTGEAASRPALAFLGVASGAGPVRSADGALAPLGATHAEGRALVALFGARREPARVKLLTAGDGNPDALKSLWSGGVEVMHFSTHGLANLRQPLASLLLLPAVSATGEATYLTAGQVQEWQGDTGLVFLGACESAAGPARFGDGIPGLPRAFLRAGARGVIATLWPVEDVYASRFSLDFYRRFIAHGDAERALAETQRDWSVPVAGERPDAQGRRLATAWAHVFYARSSDQRRSAADSGS